MPPPEVICPACASRVQPPASLRAGDVMECPMCATEFALGGRDERLMNRPPPQRLEEANEEGLEEANEEEGRRVDLEIVEDEQPRVRKRSRRGRRAQSGSVELTRWISLGFTHWFPMLPPSLGFFFVYLLVYIGAIFVIGCLGIFLRRFPVVGNLICLFLLLSVMVPLSAGMTLVCVQQLQGRRWSFGDFFSGQQWWLPIVGNYVLLQILYGFLCLGPPMMLQLVLGDSPLLLLLGWGFSAFVYLLLYPLTWMFSWQLMLDGNYGPVEAITENVQMALPHYVKLLPLAALTLLIRVLGVMLCGVGFAAAWPLAVLIESAAYLRLTGRRVAQSPSEIN